MNASLSRTPEPSNLAVTVTGVERASRPADDRNSPKMRGRLNLG